MNMMDSPLVSVVIATYRREETFKQALQSLVEQTYGNVEVIVVDDNADDRWNNKVKAILETEKAKRITVNFKLIVNISNKGSANARNEGIFAANGEYITFLDDDDIYLPEKIKNQVARIHESGADFCISDLYLYDDQDRLIDKRVRNYFKVKGQNSLLSYHLKYHMTGTDALMFKASFLRKIGGFPTIDVGDEFYLVLRAIENDAVVAYLPYCDVKAYVHTENGGLSTGQGKIAGENALFKKKKEYFSQLSKEDVRFIKMRHFAVLAVANKNTRRFWRFAGCALVSFLVSPTGFFRLIIDHKGR